MTIMLTGDYSARSRALKNLQSKGLVNASPEYPYRFSAVVLEKALDLLLKARKQQQKALQESKEQLLSTWRSITQKDAPKANDTPL